MTSEAKGIELQIDPDVRLAAAAGGAARYLAEAAGLTSEEAAELQKSIVAACEETFEHLTGERQRLQVRLSRFPDRIEVALAHEGGSEPAVGLDRIAGFATQIGASGGLGGVDRVQYETRGGLAITRLTKYLGHLPPIQ
ncbi:MAG TPA: hypothetical protein VJW94_18800 [Candidatus Acidoferrum sp.]|nr:hypothetical protein [Candidatus Acidoferrum sp.]